MQGVLGLCLLLLLYYCCAVWAERERVKPPDQDVRLAQAAHIVNFVALIMAGIGAFSEYHGSHLFGEDGMAFSGWDLSGSGPCEYPAKAMAVFALLAFVLIIVTFLITCCAETSHAWANMVCSLCACLCSVLAWGLWLGLCPEEILHDVKKGLGPAWPCEIACFLLLTISSWFWYVKWKRGHGKGVSEDPIL